MSDFRELVQQLKEKQEREERQGLLETFVKNDAYDRNLDVMIESYKEMFAEKFPAGIESTGNTYDYEKSAAAWYAIYGTKGEF